MLGRIGFSLWRGGVPHPKSDIGALARLIGLLLSFPFFAFQKLQVCSAHSNLMFGQQPRKLIAIHQTDGNGVGALGFPPGAGAEIARCHDQALLMGSKAASDLLHHGRSGTR